MGEVERLELMFLRQEGIDECNQIVLGLFFTKKAFEAVVGKQVEVFFFHALALLRIFTGC
jgi:hypothetical protein